MVSGVRYKEGRDIAVDMSPLPSGFHRKVQVTSVQRIAAFLAVVWLVLQMDTFISWFFSSYIVIGISAIIMFAASFIVFSNSYFHIDSKRNSVALCVVLIIFLNILKSDSIVYMLSIVLRFLPLLLFIYWDGSTVEQSYVYFRNFILFYAVGSTIIVILIATGLIDHLPYISMPPRDIVQENSGTTNRIYGVFVVPDAVMGLSTRLSGPLREGGHFSLFLGITFFVERCVYGRNRISLFVAGILTLSPNFLIVFMLTLLYTSISNKTFFKTMSLFVIGIAAAVGIFFVLPASVQEKIIYTVFERSLGDALEAMQDGGLVAALDVRTDDLGKLGYEDFEKNASIIGKLLGMPPGDLDPQCVLSDYRRLIYMYGYIGLALILLLSWRISRMNKSAFGTCVFLFAILVVLHRSWMFIETYIFIVMFMSSCCKINHQYDKPLVRWSV